MTLICRTCKAKEKVRPDYLDDEGVRKRMTYPEFAIDDYVLILDVAVCDAILLEVDDHVDDLCKDVLGVFLREALALRRLDALE